jgi:hypothetical protein
LDILTYLGCFLPFRENHIAIYKGDEGLLSCVVAGEGRGGFCVYREYMQELLKNLKNGGIAV